jgi:histidinol-phosphatase
MKPIDPGHWLPFLEKIADRADEIALRFFRAQNLQVEEKVDLSPVTEADRAIEEVAQNLLREHHPDLGIYGEEYGEQVGSGNTRLIIDPIDGTRNFVRGIPIFATLLAIEKDGEILAGLVTAPALQTRWKAARGYGAYCGKRRLYVSRIRDLPKAHLFHGTLGGSGESLPPGSIFNLMRQVQRTRGFGDFYQHVLVAEGAGEVAIDPAVKPWDIAPLQVIVEEAGGQATTLTGQRSIYGGSLVSSNGLLHEKVLSILADNP